MGKVVIGLFLLVMANAVEGQGTFLWTWHGNSNYFQASFQVTEAEMQPGSTFNSPLFTNSISISSLDGLIYYATNYPSPYAGGGFGPPLRLGIILVDQATLSRIEVSAVPDQGSSIVEDSPLPMGRHGESGFWSYSYVPEPGVAALFVTGALLAFLRRTRT